MNIQLKGRVKLEYITLYMFIIGVFLFLIPPFYLTPGINNAFLTSQAVARILIVVCTIFIFVFSSSNAPLNRYQKVVVLTLFLFFALQSLSIVSAVNIPAFLNRYKDIFIGMCTFYLGFQFKQYIKLFIPAILIASAVNIIYQSFIFLYRENIVWFIREFVYSRHADLVEFNIDRGRIYTETFNEIFIPFLTFSLLLLKNLKRKIVIFSLFIGISYFALASNIRSRIIMYFLSLIPSLFIFKEYFGKKALLLIPVVIICGVVIDRIMVANYGVSYVDRLLMRDYSEDVLSIINRSSQLINSYTIANTELLGVGLGNYFDSINYSPSLTFIPFYTTDSGGGQEYVHNIFGTTMAESGYISLSLFFLLIVLFVRSDIRSLKLKDPHKSMLVVAYWALFAYSLFNPPVSGSFLVLFWGIRGFLL